jgi:lipoprotein-releasing system permease protein
LPANPGNVAGSEPPPFGAGEGDLFDKFEKLAEEKAAENPNDLFPPEAPEKPANPNAPLHGRLYVGQGLISFPYDEEGTGKVKTQYMVRPGDDVRISTVSSGQPPTATHFNATVVDVFKCGMSEYDSNLVFCNLEYLQDMRGMITPETGVRNITSIQIKLKDFEDADEIVKDLQAAFPPGLFSVRTWEQKQGPLLSAVEVESAILNVLLFLIIAVAGFGILAIFYMIVVEKTRDIGILKSLGASSRGVMSIFLSYGLALGIVGSGVGVALGLVFVRNINTIDEWISWATGRKVFDEKIYYFPEIPTSVNPMMVFSVALGAMTIAVLASVLPARRASRLHPVEALRYE